MFTVFTRATSATRKICCSTTDMANNKNLSAFRQLSLSCDGPKIHRKLSLKKQFSEDIPDLRGWPDQDVGFKIPLSNKGIRNPLIKQAWTENDFKTVSDGAVIVNKCREVRRASSGKLCKQGSLEKDSILHSKQELADRLRQTLKDRGNEKFNLRIFLAHDSRELHEDKEKEQFQYLEKPREQPQLKAPLVANKNPFRIRRSKTLSSDSCSSFSPTATSKDTFESSTVVVVPLMENDDQSIKEDTIDSRYPKETIAGDEAGIKAIDSVIIRPVSAASKREKFQKRINSAFTSTVKEPSKPRRPLVRSSSAPCKPDHGKSKYTSPKNKFKASRRLVHGKTISIDNDDVDDKDEKSPKSKKELNRTTAVHGCDIVTMVSLVSPAGSDCEEAVETSADSCKGSQKKETENVQEENNIPKIMSLRKAAKSVSFQQSSIHAIRSFSASFPARRASVAAALMLGNHSKPSVSSPKVQEKRSTNSTVPDDNERVPKRRLVRSNTEEPKTVSCEKLMETKRVEDKVEPIVQKSDSTSEAKPESANGDAVNSCSDDFPVRNEAAKSEILPANDKEELKSAKEKQCWSMYCKMTEKGINVSFDTILRGMLTPTEYRLSKKHSEAASNSELPGN